MSNKNNSLTAKVISVIFALASVITIVLAINYMYIQKYNPLISIAILTVGIVNLVLAYKIYQGKAWAYHSLMLYFISALPIVLINPLNIYIKISLVLLTLLLITFFVKSVSIKKFFKVDELNNIKDTLIESWSFTKEDNLQSWAIVISLILILMKFALFPLLTLLTGTSLPIVIVESCSMYHQSDFSNWWYSNSAWYEKNDITSSEFESYSFKNGMNKGDIILVQAQKEYEKGDVIIFTAPTTHPIIHRIVDVNPIATKGDNNSGQIDMEKDISESRVIGKAVFRIPLLGWIKLIFFEPFQNENNKGLCS